MWIFLFTGVEDECGLAGGGNGGFDEAFLDEFDEVQGLVAVPLTLLFNKNVVGFLDLEADHLVNQVEDLVVVLLGVASVE